MPTHENGESGARPPSPPAGDDRPGETTLEIGPADAAALALAKFGALRRAPTRPADADGERRDAPPERQA